MGDTTPIPGPSRGLSGSANLTVLLKFAPDQPPLPWQRKFENFSKKQQKLNLKTYQFITMCKGDIYRHQPKKQKSIWG